MKSTGKLSTPFLRKVDYFYFLCDNFGTSERFLTVTFRKDLCMKLELKLPPPVESVVALPFESVQLFYIHISKNDMLHVRRHQFHEFKNISLFLFLSDNDVIVT